MKQATIKNVLKEFNKQYSFILDNNGNVSGVKEASMYFEEEFNGLLPLIKDFVLLRGEFIDTSNEKASFIFALQETGLLV